jgi:hypothetical protein
MISVLYSLRPLLAAGWFIAIFQRDGVQDESGPTRVLKPRWNNDETKPNRVQHKVLHMVRTTHPRNHTVANRFPPDPRTSLSPNRLIRTAFPRAGCRLSICRPLKRIRVRRIGGGIVSRELKRRRSMSAAHRGMHFHSIHYFVKLTFPARSSGIDAVSSAGMDVPTSNPPVRV